MLMQQPLPKNAKQLSWTASFASRFAGKSDELQSIATLTTTSTASAITCKMNNP